MANGMTIKEAAQKWVTEMNAYKQDMIQTLMDANPDDWNEVTKIQKHDSVYIYNMPEKDIDGNDIEYDSSNGKIIEIKKTDDGVLYIIETDGNDKVELISDDFEVERDGYLPMWGTLWSFRNSADDYWLEELNGIELMSECGFRIFEHEEWGYFFGIDGCGYSFYDEHWIPLYKKRGLHWHNPKTEQEYQMQSKGYQKKSHGNTECWYYGDKFIEEVIK